MAEQAPDNIEVADQESQETEVAMSDSETQVSHQTAQKSMEMEAEKGGATAAVEGIDRLLQQHRSEIMFELRRLQHGDRPVTGQGNKEAVEDFFTRAMSSDAPSPATAEAQRPENVVVEVNALVERRPVSSILQSLGFRRSLESALRGAIGPQPGRSPLESLLARRTQGASGRQPSPTVQRSTNTREQAAAVQDDQSSVSSYATVRSQASRSENRSVIPPPPTPLVSHSTPTGPARAQAWIQREVPVRLDVQQERHQHAWDSVEQMQHDNMIADITELVQEQLVTSALHGNFRATLENHMRTRLDAVGGDGRRVQQFLHSLPRTQFIPRNDFSDLGIMGPQQAHAANSDSLADDISVISATAAVAVPYAQSNVAMGREISSLKSQINELKNMMKLSFDLQLDIQRSIRQEVAAALGNNQSASTSAASQPQAAPSAPAPSSQNPAHARPASESQCLICLDNSVDSVLYQCGHMCVCYACGLNLRARAAHCPVCRAPIRDIIRAYKTNVESE